MYESQISFTLDTICPWTFLAKKRLDQALAQVRSDSPAAVSFTIRYEPYQLDPHLPDTVDKQQWYLTNKHLGNQDAQGYAQTYMTSLFQPLGVNLRFDGTMGNTLQAHRVVQFFQDEQQGGPEVAGRIIDSLYRQYFNEARHPADEATLVQACVDAGVEEGEARRVVGDKTVGERAVKDKLRMVARDVEAVPVVTIEGRRRDLTLTGAKDATDYVKALETVIKESS